MSGEVSRQGISRHDSQTTRRHPIGDPRPGPGPRRRIGRSTPRPRSSPRERGRHRRRGRRHVQREHRRRRRRDVRREHRRRAAPCPAGGRAPRWTRAPSCRWARGERTVTRSDREWTSRSRPIPTWSRSCCRVEAANPSEGTAPAGSPRISCGTPGRSPTRPSAAWPCGRSPTGRSPAARWCWRISILEEAITATSQVTVPLVRDQRLIGLVVSLNTLADAPAPGGPREPGDDGDRRGGGGRRRRGPGEDTRSPPS